MKKIGLTGGIGSGKSIVAKMFINLGVKVYDADANAKKLIEDDLNVKNRIISLLGQEAYLGQKYNRLFVSNKVFENKNILNELNAIVHPAVFEHFTKWCESWHSENYIIKEAAIMAKNTGLDKIIVVKSPIELRVKRILNRDSQRFEKDIYNIIANQKSDEEFEEIADFVITNDEKEFLIPQILAVHQQLSQLNG